MSEAISDPTEDKTLSILISNAYLVYSWSILRSSNVYKIALGGAVYKTPFEILHNPAVGDLVMEMSSIAMRDQDKIRIGYLDRTAIEPYPKPDGMTDEEYAAEYAPDPIPTELVYYIRLLVDGRECRWTNARFVRVIEDWRSMV